jgi:hypothetical protein
MFQRPRRFTVGSSPVHDDDSILDHEQDEQVPDVECRPALHNFGDGPEASRESDFRRDDEFRGRFRFARLFPPQAHPAVEVVPLIRLFASQVFTIVLPVNLSILSLVTLEDNAPVDLSSSFSSFSAAFSTTSWAITSLSHALSRC